MDPRTQEAVRRRLRLRVRREAQDRLGHRAGRGQGRALPRHRPPLPRRERPSRQPPDPGAEGRVALQARRRLRGDRRRGEDHRRVHRPHPRGQALVGGAAPGGRGEGGRGDPGGEPDARDDHLPELLPPLRQARGHDRHGADRGDRVHEDLRAAGRPDPDQQADGPRRPQRPGLQDQRRQVGGRGQGDRGAPRERPAGARRHDLGRGLRAALRPADASAGSSTRCSTPSPSTPSARREIDRRGRPARRGDDRDQHGRPRRRHQARRQRRAPRAPSSLRSEGIEPGDEGYDERSRELRARDRGARSRPSAST